MIQTGMLLENGKVPDEFYAQYISPKMTLLDVKEKLCTRFKLKDIEKT